MKKTISILLLTSVLFNVFAQENSIKVKTKIRDEVLNMKILLKNPMIGYKESVNVNFQAYKEVKPIDYITKITTTSNNEIVFNMDTNPYLSKNPVLKFKIKNTLISDKAELTIQYSSGKKENKLFNIESTNNNQTIKKSPSKNKPNNSQFWEVNTVKKAIEILFGSKKMLNDVLDVKTPKVASSPYYIPISLDTDIELETIVVLMTGNPQAAVSIISIPYGKLLHFSTRVKLIYPIQVSKNKHGKYEMSYSTYITVIGKARDGKLYRTTKFVETPTSGTPEIEDYEIKALYKIQH